MDCLMAMGLGWDAWGVGDDGLWGVGDRVQSDRGHRLLSSTQILFSFFEQNKTQANIYLVFYTIAYLHDNNKLCNPNVISYLVVFCLQL